MKPIKIANCDLDASEISLGCMRISALTNQEISVLVHTALDAGINFFDHADIYGGGKSEEKFSAALKMNPGLREEVLLKVDDLRISFGGVQALAGVSLEVHRGEIFSPIGPNGAGKTVLLNCINGLYRPEADRVLFEGTDITRVPSPRRAALGIARTLQQIWLFSGMTVLDNIRLGRLSEPVTDSASNSSSCTSQYS